MNDQDAPPKQRHHGMRRLIPLPGLLLALTLFCIARDAIRLPSVKNTPSWLEQGKIREFLEGQTLELPDGDGISEPRGRTVMLQMERMESLRIEPQDSSEVGGTAQISFAYTVGETRYIIQGFVYMHNIDGLYHPIVNLGKGWYVTKQ
jgi:hypothetical protein